MRIGESVLCINDYFTEEIKTLIPNLPRKDLVYIVRDVLITRNGKAYLLEEIINPQIVHPSNMGTFEGSFSVNRFRKTDDIEDLVETIEEEQYAT